MNDELDALNDRELSECFAIEVAGWMKLKRGIDVFYDPEGGHVVPNDLPQFATDANAVLPWLEKGDSWDCLFDQGEVPEYTVQAWTPNYGKGEAPTFASAACIALICARRAAKAQTA